MRRATQEDLELIVRLLDAAFAPSQAESKLVRALVEKTRPIHQWVLEGEGILTAYLCYSLAYQAAGPIGFHLAPVAVHPLYQRRGLGSTLIRETLLEPPVAGNSIFVLGEPSYYERFGFRRVRQPVCPFELNNEHFMALHYEYQAEFEIGYEPEFMNGEPS